MTTKTIAQKLLIKPDSSVWVSSPDDLELIGPLPDRVGVADSPENATTVLLFVGGAQALRDVLSTHRDALANAVNVWVAYPKGNRADINRDSVWPILGEYRMNPVSQVAIDDVWSAMRFRALREGEALFTGGR
jgi:hypothetical protein